MAQTPRPLTPSSPALKDGASPFKNRLSATSNRNKSEGGSTSSTHTRSALCQCARCSLMRIVQYRFARFRLAFGRRPGPHEPLFFDESYSFPVQAQSTVVIEQMREAARLTGVDFIKIAEFLNLV
jgi:hypothetical protein